VYMYMLCSPFQSGNDTVDLDEICHVGLSEGPNLLLHVRKLDQSPGYCVLPSNECT